MPKVTSIRADLDVTYAPHFTAENIASCQRITQWLDDRQFKVLHLARLARVNQSTLTQILKGYYESNPTKHLTAVESAMQHKDETAHDVIAPVETSVYKLAHTAAAMARRYRNFAVLSAYVGTGKTFALKRYVAEHANTYFIEATPTMTTFTLMEQLCMAVLGMVPKVTNLELKFRAVVNGVKNTDSLFIIDEAETLTPHQLHTLRRLRDLSNVGILLAGTEHLRGLIAPEHGQFDQIRSRTGFWPETVTKITLDDAAALAQSAFGAEEIDDAVLQRLYDYSKGSARMLVEGLIAGIKEFRKGRSLDVKLVDAVAKQVLCLQSLS